MNTPPKIGDIVRSPEGQEGTVTGKALKNGKVVGISLTTDPDPQGNSTVSHNVDIRSLTLLPPDRARASRAIQSQKGKRV